MENLVMKILFLTETDISPIQGGTEHITHTLSQAFRAKGHKCFLGYLKPIASDLQATEFDGKCLLVVNDKLQEQLGNFLKDNEINIVVVNFVSKSSKQAILPLLYTITRTQGAKVVVCYHAMPGEDVKPSCWSHIFYQIRHRYNISQAIKDAFLHLSPIWLNRRLIQPKYRLSPKYADAFVLLSEKFYQPYMDIAGAIPHDNFYAIGNALSYENINVEKIKEKEKTVLIVARQQERSKKLSKALRVWQFIENMPDLKEWKLQIVGGGPDAGYYKQLHQQLGLQRCDLLGRQPEIEPFYEKASIFMMTSSYEGFGITLTEAQQFGCVPIVQNTYASLTDIIRNNENGVIVDSEDSAIYAQQLAQLMRATDEREEMARIGLQTCRQFSLGRITQKWLTLFNHILQA